MDQGPRPRPSAPNSFRRAQYSDRLGLTILHGLVEGGVAIGVAFERIGAMEQAPESVRPNIYAMFQILPGGNVAAANRQGHGPGWGHSGRQLLEFDPSGQIVWSWSKAELIPSLQAILVLDGLDPETLHHERHGVMAPSDL